ncbi:MAG: hypothetical protein GKR94_31580 [Gammaproteobacteria bacterium]|nr:hypothetical protein [Gammaproteobacteria bacterium]
MLQSIDGIEVAPAAVDARYRRVAGERLVDAWIVQAGDEKALRTAVPDAAVVGA